MNELVSKRSVSENFSAELFKAGNPYMGPVYTWAWNAPVDKKGIDEQLDSMKKAGMRGVYVLPEPREFRPASMRTDMEPGYLTKEFFELSRYAAEAAMKRGISVWLYDEGGWPSGSACTQVNTIRPESCRWHITENRYRLSKGESYKPCERAISAFDENGKQLDEGFFACRDTEITEYFAKPEGGYAGNPLDAEGVKLFMELTHNGYEKTMGDLLPQCMANGIQLMFTDEPGAGMYPWPIGFSDAFFDRYGYRPEKYLPFIKNDGIDADDEACQARIDYRKLLGEMFLSNYFVPVHEWCRKNGLLSGGHLDQDNLTDGCLYHSYGSVLPLLREMDVPGVDVIWRQIDIPKNGSRPCGDANAFFPRFASSAAAQGGGKYALSESFAIYGQGLTGDEIRYTVNYQLVRGINIINFMSSSYGKNGMLPVHARPGFVPEMPDYFHLAGMNDCISRECALMSTGLPVTKTALFFPAEEIWAGGSRRAKAKAAFEKAGCMLEENHVQFDVIDTEGLLACEINDGHIKMGLADYTCLAVPEGISLPESVAEKVKAFITEPEAETVCADKRIRVHGRVTPDGSRIWMLFNEAGEAVNTEFVCDAHGFAYRLYPESGRIEKSETEEKLTLEAGEAAFFIISKAELAAEEKLREAAVIRLDDFAAARISRTVFGKLGIGREEIFEPSVKRPLGPWQEWAGADFSGEVKYQTKVCFDGKGILELHTGRLECWASVYVDGEFAGEICTCNGCLRIPEKLTEGKKAFELTLVVANTGANCLNALKLPEMFDKRDIGQYNERVSIFERSAPKGGLYGPVTVKVLG